MALPAPKRQMRPGRKILFSCISVGLFLGLSELACWGFKLAPPKRPPFKFIVRDFENDVEYPFVAEDADLLWALKPGFRGRELYYGADVQINSIGFRDREYPVAKSPGVFRILCLGDSTTFGFGLPIDDTYHCLLEEMLNLTSNPSGIRYEVINAGVTGYSSKQCLLMYEYKGRKLCPDIVLLNAGANDFFARSHLTDDQILARWRPSVLVRLHDVLSYSHGYRTLAGRLSGSAEYDEPHRLEVVPRVSPEAFKRNIVELDESCRSDACRLVLISSAYCSQVARHNYTGSDEDFAWFNAFLLSYRQPLESVARERQIPLLSVPELTTAPEAGLFLDGSHPNRQGHLILALHLYHFLRGQGLLPKASYPSTSSDGSPDINRIRRFLVERGYFPEEDRSPPQTPVRERPVDRVRP